MIPFLLLIFSFLIASIPFGLLIGRAYRGIDIREHGSGNIGTTNVFRVLGKGPGIGCLVLDILKGYVPVLFALNLLQFEGNRFVQDFSVFESWRVIWPAEQQYLVQGIQVLCAFFAILGHNYSPWLGFKGGKGIATSAGVLIALMPFAVLILIALFLVVFLTSRYVSLASIVAAAALPLVTLWGSFHHGKIQDGTWNISLFVFSLLIGFLAIWKHRPNIQRLRNGTENRFGKKQGVVGKEETSS